MKNKFFLSVVAAIILPLSSAVAQVTTASNIVKMAADLQRPYIYALQAPAVSGQSGNLLFINTTNGNIDKTLTIGINPVDLTINYAEGRLYIASWTETWTYVVDLNKQTLLPSLNLGTDIYKINADGPGRIITEGEDQWIAVNIVDTTTGNVVGSMPWPEREGDGETDPTGTFYYHCDNNISDAYIHKEQIVNDVVTEVAGSLQHPYGSRNLILSPDGSTLFWQGYIYDANLNELGSLGEEIYATTAHGDLALGAQHVFNAHNGQTVYTWPFSASVMAVSGDQQKVFLYNSASNQLITIPMSAIASVPGPGLNPTPAEGSVVNPPLAQVSWTASPLALSYRIFCGTNQAAVAAADTNSALYLGLTTSNSFSLPAPVGLGLTYYWRVDSVGFSSTIIGTIWSFTVSPLMVTPQTLSLSGVVGLPVLPQTISLSAPLPTAWNLAIAQSWISASATNGATSSSVALQLSTTNLTAGLYTNQITLTANGITLQLPVVLQLFNLNASKMVADPNRNMIYVLHPGSGSFADAFLLFLNTDTGVVEKVIPIGTNPTDLTVNRFEDRLYVSNWLHNQTRVVDLATRIELTPLALGTDVYKINAGRAGRIITESEDQWITVNIVDTFTGNVVDSMAWSLYEGDGETDPTGTVYYHGDYGISDAHIHKFICTNDTLVEVADSNQHYGERNLLLSADGTKLFWNSYVYDTNLTELGTLGAEIYACSTNGSVAFGSSQAFDTASKRVIYNLPASSTVSIVDRQNQRYWYFDSITATIGSIPMSVIESPSISQQPASYTTVAVSNSVYLTATAIGLSPLSYQWTLAGTNLAGATNYFLSINNIELEQSGDYQLIATNSYGSVTSLVAYVSVLIPPAIATQPSVVSVLAGSNALISVGAIGSVPITYQWSFGGIAIANATNSTLTVSNAQSVNGGYYQVTLANDVGTATSLPIILRVLPSKALIVSGPSPVSVPAGSQAVFSANVIGSAPLTFQWYKDGALLSGAVSSQLIISNAQAANAGLYQLLVSNFLGTAVSPGATLTVLPVRPSFVLQPVSVAAVAGSSVSFESLAAGSDDGLNPIRYAWYFQSNRITGQTSHDLSLPSITATNQGAYFVVASNSYGAATSAVAQLTVYLPPSLQIGLSNLVVDEGETVVLNPNATGTPPLAYSWNFNTIQLTNTAALLSLTNITRAQSGYYSVTVTNQYGSISATGKISVFLPASPVVAWGDDSGGQIDVPANLDDAVAVAGGDYHSVAIRHDGTLVAWGFDDEGQIDVPTNSLRFVSVASGADHNLAIAEDGSVVAWGRDDGGQTDVPGTVSSVLSVAAGNSHSLALLASGTVVAWGDDTYGQTDIPFALMPGYLVYYWWGEEYWVINLSWVPVQAIAAGRNHNLALLYDGTVVAWGDNSFGQASPPSNLSNVVAITAGYLHSAALCSNGTVVVWGDNTFGQTNVPPGLSNVVAIAAGDFHTLALLSNGTVVGWGDDTFGQLDVPSSVTQAVGIASGYYHGLALVPLNSLLLAHLTRDGLVMQWNGAGILQWAPTPTGPYAVVLCQGNSWTNLDMSAPAKFFRLRR
jgi:hypothetical protein